MDLSTANTEPFLRLHRFHEQLNRTIKASTACHVHVARGMQRARDPATWLGDLIRRTEEPWGKFPRLVAPTKELDVAMRFLSSMAVVRVSSAFEDHLAGLEAELSRWMAASNGPGGSVPASGDKEAGDEGAVEASVLARMRRLGVVDTVATFLPVWRFFSAARNVIVHRNGRPTDSLRLLRADAVKALAAWATKRGTVAVTPPEIGEAAAFLRPRDAILYSECCHRMAQAINGALIPKFGEAGLVHMAAFHSLLKDQPEGAPSKGRTPAAVVLWMLSGSLRVRGATQADVSRTLKALGKWDECRVRYGELVFPGSTRAAHARRVEGLAEAEDGL